MSSQPAGIPTRAGTPVLPTSSLPFAAPNSAQGKSPGTAGTDVQHFENLLSKATTKAPRPAPNTETAAARSADPSPSDAAAPESEAAEQGDVASVPIRPRKTRGKESEASDADKLLMSLAFVAQPPPPQPMPTAPVNLAATLNSGETPSEDATASGSVVMAAGDPLISSMPPSSESVPLNEARPQPRADTMSASSTAPRTQDAQGSDGRQTPDDTGSKEKKGDWIEGLKPDSSLPGKHASEVLKESAKAVPAVRVDMEKVAATSREAGIAGLDLIGKAKVTESDRKADAGRSSTTASPGGTWSAQQSSDVTAVENNVAEATPAKAPAGARFGRDHGASSPTDLAATVSGLSSASPDVAQIPQETVEVTSVKEPREVMLEQILDHAATVRQSGHDSLGVTIRANDRTEILVHFKYVDGIVHAQAQLERGDLSLLNSQWQDLQTHLARQGVNLSPLNTTASREGGLGQNAQDGQGQPRHFTPGDSREGQGWAGWTAGNPGGRSAASTTRNNAATDRVQRNLGLLETWA